MKSVYETLIFHARAIKSGDLPAVFASNQLIHLYWRNTRMTEAHKVFDEMPDRNVFSWNTIISAYIKCQNLGRAKSLFESAPERDLVTYNSMLSGYAAADGYEMSAFELFKEMQSRCDHLRFDDFTLTTILNLVAKFDIVSYGRQLHSYMVKTANDRNGFALSSLIDMYSKCRCFREAYLVFDQCDEEEIASLTRNAMLAACCREGQLGIALDIFWRRPELNDKVSWNTLISAYTRNGCAEESIRLFVEMEKNGVKWDEHTFASLLSACSDLKLINHGKEIHAWVLKKAMISNPYVSSGLVDVYCKCGNMNYAEAVNSGSKIKNPFSITSMIAGYASQGNMMEARRLFDSLLEKNSVIWTCLFSGYIRAQKHEAIFDLLNEYMQHGHMILDAPILLSILGACSFQATLDLGRQVHAYMLRREIEVDKKLTSALIDMYAKSGNLAHAEKIFNSVVERDSVLYNIMIAGYACHGRQDNFMHLYNEMLENGLKPDSVTFVALLSGCRHRGLVEMGEQYFKSMTKDNEIVPETEHYACMIDLYGRRNQLEKAYEFIDTIPNDALDAVIWGAFLNACKVNGNLELAREAENKVLRIEGQNGSRYVQLSNMYAGEGNWSEVGRIRKRMRGRDVKKVIGCSWIYLENVVHAFSSGNNVLLHSKIDEIYSALTLLTAEARQDRSFLIEQHLYV